MKGIKYNLINNKTNIQYDNLDYMNLKNKMIEILKVDNIPDDFIETIGIDRFKIFNLVNKDKKRGFNKTLDLYFKIVKSNELKTT